MEKQDKKVPYSISIPESLRVRIRNAVNRLELKTGERFNVSEAVSDLITEKVEEIEAKI